MSKEIIHLKIMSYIMGDPCIGDNVLGIGDRDVNVEAGARSDGDRGSDNRFIKYISFLVVDSSTPR